MRVSFSGEERTGSSGTFTGCRLEESGNRDRGEEIVLFPLWTRRYVNVPVMSRRVRNMIPAGLFIGAHVRRRFLRREEAQEGIACAEGVR